MSTLKTQTLALIHQDRLASLPAPSFGTRPNATLSVRLDNPYPDTFQIGIRRGQSYVSIQNPCLRSLRLHLNAKQVGHAFHGLFEGLYLLRGTERLSDIGKHIRATGDAVPSDIWKAVRRHMVSHQFDEIAITFESGGEKYSFPLLLTLALDSPAV